MREDGPPAGPRGMFDSTGRGGDPEGVNRHAILAAALAVLAVSPVPAAAQGRQVQLDGVVQWIAGDKLMLILDSGPSVAVELRQVRQDQYSTLTQRDRVTVLGTVSPDNRRVYATSIFRDRSDTQSP